MTFPATLAVDPPAATQEVQARVLALFDECAPGVRRYVASFNLDATTTDDVVQEVFLALFRHLTLGRPGTNLNGWLFRVAHNLSLKQRQRTARRGRVEGPWDAISTDDILDSQLNPEERLAEQQRQRRLVNVVRLMPERDRRCLSLRAEGLCYRDIAKTLGVSLGSVAKSVVRALSRLTAADRE